MLYDNWINQRCLSRIDALVVTATSDLHVINNLRGELSTERLIKSSQAERKKICKSLLNRMQNVFDAK